MGQPQADRVRTAAGVGLASRLPRQHRRRESAARSRTPPRTAQPEPWWQVDPGAPPPIDEIACGTDRLLLEHAVGLLRTGIGPAVRLGLLTETGAQPGVPAFLQPGHGPTSDRVAAGVTGRYVRVQFQLTAPHRCH